MLDVGTVGISMPFPAHPWLGDTVSAFDMDWVRTSIIHQPSEPTNQLIGKEGTILDPAEELLCDAVDFRLGEASRIILKSADTFINRRELFHYQCFQTICIIASLVRFSFLFS